MNVFNGSQITIDDEDDIIPVEYVNGELKAVGRTVFFFELISGSVKMGVGQAIDDGFTNTDHSTAGDRWFHTASPDLNRTIPDFNGNIRASGTSGVVKIYW